MLKVKFYDQASDSLLKFAVIISISNGKYVFCKHKERDTYEVPGGHREPGEAISDTACRELREETGAIDFTITPICIYSVIDYDDGNTQSTSETFGMLYFAEISSFDEDLHCEIEKIILSDHPVENWTYPLIQPELMKEAERRGFL